MKYKIALLPGDGIGPEVMAEAVKILERIKTIYEFDIELTQADVGGCAIDSSGMALPQIGRASCRERV